MLESCLSKVGVQTRVLSRWYQDRGSVPVRATAIVGHPGFTFGDWDAHWTLQRPGVIVGHPGFGRFGDWDAQAWWQTSSYIAYTVWRSWGLRRTDSCRTGVNRSAFSTTTRWYGATVVRGHGGTGPRWYGAGGRQFPGLKGRCLCGNPKPASAFVSRRRVRLAAATFGKHHTL